MDFFKSAIASAISQGPLPGYTIAERVDVEQSIWTLNNGTKKVGLPPVALHLGLDREC